MFNPSTMLRFFLVLAVASFANALFDDDPELSLNPPTVRSAGPIDIRGEYLLVEATGEEPDLCPTNITHTTWRRISDGTIGLPHNTIVQDDERCESTDDERSLRFWQGSDYDADFNPLRGADPLPEDFISVMTISGFNVNARIGIEDQGDRYLMGYENTIRVCGGMSRFGIGTTAFLTRPTSGDIVINNLETPLTPGLKYLLMVPRFRRTYCLYSSDVNGPDDNFRPLPTDDVPETAEPTGIEETITPSPTRRPRPPGPRPPVGPIESPGVFPTPTDDDFTMEPTLTPEDPDSTDAQLPDDEDDPVCFPAEAAVVLDDGRRKRMDEIEIGDNVQVGDGLFSRVFAFTHKDASVKHEFITVKTSTHEITATTGHYVYINNKAARLETACKGDKLTLSTGAASEILTISKSVNSGLYNPQTLHGDIVVNDVLATTYTTTVDPRLAHAALAPIRALFNICGLDSLTKSVPDLRTLWLRAKSM